MKILSITWNQEALPPACLNNSGKTRFWHMKVFYSTCLYDGYWKKTFYTTVLRLKDEIKLFSELKANEILSYISDKISLKSLAYLAEIFEKLNNFNLKLQEKGANITYLRDESASILFEVAKLASQSNARKRCCVWKIVKCCWKNWRTWWEFEDIYNRPPSFPWNWVSVIFPWAQGGRSTCAKSFLHLSGHSLAKH